MVHIPYSSHQRMSPAVAALTCLIHPKYACVKVVCIVLDYTHLIKTTLKKVNKINDN